MSRLVKVFCGEQKLPRTKRQIRDVDNVPPGLVVRLFAEDAIGTRGDLRGFGLPVKIP